MSCEAWCDRCGQELVIVDNPMRREVRHKRGVECDPIDIAAQQRMAELLKNNIIERKPPWRA